MEILLIANDVRLAGDVRAAMGRGGGTVHWMVSGEDAEPALRARPYDCIVIECSAQERDGESFVRRLRLFGFDVPVLIIAIGNRIEDRIRLLDLGADDLLVKPVHLEELMARLRALLRRCPRAGRFEAALLHGSLRLVPASRTVSRDGVFVPLTRKEFWLLERLLRSKGRVLTRRTLEEEAPRGEHRDIASNPIEVHVHHLRRKLGRAVIRTVRGVGYTIGADL